MTAIVTTRIAPPIPSQRFDWMATREDYEPGEPIGRGATEREAVEDLFDSEEYRRECYEKHRMHALDQQHETQLSKEAQ